MKRGLKYILLTLLVLFILIQFVRPERNIASGPEAFANDISTVYAVPTDVENILVTSCYDCHSNSTNYPWYSKVQPTAWWLSDHIKEGKKELNFSVFATYSIRRQYRKLEEVIDQVKEDEMPLSSYTLIHRKARLSAEQKQKLSNWATAIRDSIKVNYPADSLIKK